MRYVMSDDTFRKLTLEEAVARYGECYKLNTVWICPKCGEDFENEDAAEYEWGCPHDFTPLIFGFARFYPDETTS
jgi:hypothetical protein